MEETIHEMFAYSIETGAYLEYLIGSRNGNSGRDISFWDDFEPFSKDALHGVHFASGLVCTQQPIPTNIICANGTCLGDSSNTYCDGVTTFSCDDISDCPGGGYVDSPLPPSVGSCEPSCPCSTYQIAFGTPGVWDGCGNFPPAWQLPNGCDECPQGYTLDQYTCEFLDCSDFLGPGWDPPPFEEQCGQCCDCVVDEGPDSCVECDTQHNPCRGEHVGWTCTPWYQDEWPYDLITFCCRPPKAKPGVPH